ncbi:PTS sugar transporter subunit IIB [Clostridium intestinale]|uniref:PTS system, cellobiose-specific IIB component n=1 Tax=Clostridium intestinale DSM 6191 TaxID=1121320 RepID=A0A1M5WM96_9CLOT|nr:PTS sugar transporter subunit IIB [Clostridium intestinale]SHH88627.1 PTS system, cellobiose-specific IIB component [Clostridium intestinale DSM 6191]
MINILLCCSAGMSTSILVKKMRQAAEEKGLEAEIWAIPESELEKNKDKADIVLLGPQIRYALENVRESVGADKPVEVIDIRDYGTMNGKKVLELALSKLA